MTKYFRSQRQLSRCGTEDGRLFYNGWYFPPTIYGDGWPKLADGRPDFGKMTSAQRQAYDEARLKRVFG